MGSGPGNKPLTSSVFYILLGLSEQPRHGLGIAEEIQARTGSRRLLGPGSLYTALKKALLDGLVEETPPPPADVDTRRRYYAITSRGRQRLREEARRLDRIVAIARELDVVREGDS